MKKTKYLVKRYESTSGPSVFIEFEVLFSILFFSIARPIRIRDRAGIHFLSNLTTRKQKWTLVSHSGVGFFRLEFI